MRYYILQECNGGHGSYLAKMPYTESGFANRHVARRYLDKHGRRFSPRIVRSDRVADVQLRFERKHD